MTPPRAAVVIALALALAACSPDAEPGAPSSLTAAPTEASSPASPSPAESPSASPSPSAAAAASPCTDPSVSLVGLAGVDFDRYMAACLGMSFTEATAAMGGSPIVGESVCPWLANIVAFDDPGFYVAAVTRPEDPGTEIFLFRMTWLSDQASAVAWDAPSTSEGVSLGSTTAEVQAAYPAASAVTIDDPSRGERQQIVVAGPDDTALVFDVTDGWVSTMYWGHNVSSGAAGELCAL